MEQEFNLKGVLELEKMTKAEISELAQRSVQPVLDGWSDGFDALILVKKGQLLMKELELKIKHSIRSKNLEGSYLKNNAEVIQKMMGVSWDFTNCNDLIYNSLLEEKKDLEDIVKQREEYLKTLVAPFDLVDTETGEVTAVLMPPIKLGASGFNVTIK